MWGRSRPPHPPVGYLNKEMAEVIGQRKAVHQWMGQGRRKGPKAAVEVACDQRPGKNGGGRCPSIFLKIRLDGLGLLTLGKP